MGRSNLWSNADSLAMVIDLSWLFLRAQSFNISLEQNINKRFEQVEQQPDVDHLDVGCLGKVVTHVDEHCGQHKHHRHIEGDNSL